MKHYKEAELKELDTQARKLPASTDTLRFICDAYKYVRKENKRLKKVIQKKREIEVKKEILNAPRSRTINEWGTRAFSSNEQR